MKAALKGPYAKPTLVRHPSWEILTGQVLSGTRG